MLMLLLPLLLLLLLELELDLEQLQIRAATSTTCSLVPLVFQFLHESTSLTNTIQSTTISRKAICCVQRATSCANPKQPQFQQQQHLSTTFFSDVIQFLPSSRLVTSRRFMSEASLNRIMEFGSLSLSPSLICRNSSPSQAL